MDAEPQELDPREIKVLADILALVLEDQPGSSEAALEAVRRKARQNRITGGALKNLFQSMAAHPGEAAERMRSRAAPDPPEATRSSIDRLRAANQTLERALAAANGETARLQAELGHAQAKLIEARQQNQGLAQRWRAGRREAGLIGAAIAICVVVFSGVIVDHFLIEPSATATVEPAPPPPVVKPPEPAPAPPPAAPTPASPAPRADGSGGATAAPPKPEPQNAQLQPGQPDRQTEPKSPADGTAIAPPLPSATSYLSPAVYDSIVAHIRACWRVYVTQLDDAHYQARLRVIADESGVVREARLAEENMSELHDPGFQTFVQAAMRSVLDRGCAQLPIPPAKLGHRMAFDFMFVP